MFQGLGRCCIGFDDFIQEIQKFMLEGGAPGLEHLGYQSFVVACAVALQLFDLSFEL